MERIGVRNSPASGEAVRILYHFILFAAHCVLHEEIGLGAAWSVVKSVPRRPIPELETGKFHHLAQHNVLLRLACAPGLYIGFNIF